MAEEKDVLEFLKPRDGKASLNEITEGLGMPKYGPNSVYALLQSLKTKGVIERRGEQWLLIGEATAVPTPSPPQTPPPVEGVTTTQARTGSISTYKQGGGGITCTQASKQWLSPFLTLTFTAIITHSQISFPAT